MSTMKELSRREFIRLASVTAVGSSLLARAALAAGHDAAAREATIPFIIFDEASSVDAEVHETTWASLNEYGSSLLTGEIGRYEGVSFIPSTPIDPTLA